MQPGDRIRIPLPTALAMAGRYARLRIGEQFRAVIFIVLYLVAFQVLVARAVPGQAWGIAVGIGLTVVGLALFLEGLFLALMPLGERVGVRLPQRVGLAGIVLFGLLLGFGSTLAEPAVAALRALGGSVRAWEAPLLYHLLENESWKLVMVIGAGVGVAVAAGMLRLYFNVSIKPFVYVLVPLLLGISVYCARDSNLLAVLGLAWNAGAVTTGAVTVPLVITLGIGVSRTIGRQNSGFGIIMLASAFPVLAVLGLALVLNAAVPPAMPESRFFAPEHQAAVKVLFPSETALRQHALQRGGESARQACYGDDRAAYRAALESLADPGTRRDLLGALSLADWLAGRASDAEREILAGVLDTEAPLLNEQPVRPLAPVLRAESISAAQSVLPLTGLLVVVLVILLRDRLRYTDELMAGIVMCIVGMAALVSGIRTGLVPLGDEAGLALPRVFRAESRETARVVLQPFDPATTVTVYDLEGRPTQWFHRQTQAGAWRRERYDPARFDAERGRYEHVVVQPPLLHPSLTFAGVGLVLLFAFGLGYGSTLAEPALSALGKKVETISVGTIRRHGVIQAVSIGVGLGLTAGVARLLYDLPLLWLLIPPYLLLLPLTWFSEEDFAGIAWDCGGVTTGVVTVPLVMAMGLGLGGALGAVDGFGALALASVFPIVTVQLYGLSVRARQRRSIQSDGRSDHA